MFSDSYSYIVVSKGRCSRVSSLLKTLVLCSTSFYCGLVVHVNFFQQKDMDHPLNPICST